MFKPRLVTARYFATRGSLPSAQTVPLPYSYFVPRNTRGNLPVYTDIRNGGTRYLVLVRNVDGNANVCEFKCILTSKTS
jgi:Mitochondrial large subunit ribosomal protein (Img2)